MKVVLIAGEKSGDLIGQDVILAIKKSFPDAKIYGVGGSAMRDAGLNESFFDFTEISIMGFAEILPKLFRLTKLLRSTVQKILELQPDFVITIDSPGFSKQVASRLRKNGLRSRFFHLVAPTVWAYKEGRAKEFARIFDKLFCILPFEPQYFRKYGLDARYICYPPLFRILPLIKPEIKREDMLIFGLGSRIGEVRRNIPLAKKIIELLKRDFPTFKVVFPTLEYLEKSLNLTAIFPEATVIFKEEEKYKYFNTAKFAILKSGTGAVEASFFGIPSVIYFLANPISMFIIRRMLKIKYANLINILLNRESIPEFIQSEATPEAIFTKVKEMLQTPELCRKQLAEVGEAKTLLINNKKYESFGEGVVHEGILETYGKI